MTDIDNLGNDEIEIIMALIRREIATIEQQGRILSTLHAVEYKLRNRQKPKPASQLTGTGPQ